jgi:hypothetical protein
MWRVALTGAVANTALHVVKVSGQRSTDFRARAGVGQAAGIASASVADFMHDIAGTRFVHDAPILDGGRQTIEAAYHKPTHPSWWRASGTW